MKYTIRNLICRLLEFGNVDEEVKVKVVLRDENGWVTHTAYLPILYLNYTNDICIEGKDITYKEV